MRAASAGALAAAAAQHHWVLHHQPTLLQHLRSPKGSTQGERGKGGSSDEAVRG